MAPPHSSDEATVALAVRVQVAGPARGTAASPSAGVIVPRSAPFDALSAGALATKPTFDAVALEEFTARCPFVERVVTRFVDGLVVGVVGVAAEVVTVVRVLTGVVGGVVVKVVEATVDVDDVVTAWVELARARGEPVEALSVKTNTKRRIGLDHITHCVLLSEWRSLMGVLDRRLPGQGEIVVHS